MPVLNNLLENREMALEDGQNSQTASLCRCTPRPLPISRRSNSDGERERQQNDSL